MADTCRRTFPGRKFVDLIACKASSVFVVKGSRLYLIIHNNVVVVDLLLVSLYVDVLLPLALEREQPLAAYPAAVFAFLPMPRTRMTSYLRLHPGSLHWLSPHRHNGMEAMASCIPCSGPCFPPIV